MRVQTSSEFFAKTLEGYGVTHLFMVPDGFPWGLAALEKTAVKRVLAHHEAAAAYMADGYARAARRPGVCIAQSVGNGNQAAGLRDAFQAGSPVISFSGGPHPNTRYRYLYQDVEDSQMFGPVTKFNARVENPARLPDLLRQAFRAATTGTPGPVHLEFPGRLGEVVLGSGDFEVIVEEQFACYPAFTPEPDPALVKRAAELLSTAKRPVIIAGGGAAVSGARQALLQLAERISAPIATTPNGKEVVPAGHPLTVGVIGSYGRRCANSTVQEADLVFFVGTRAGGLTTNNWHVPRPGARVIQVDLNPVEIGRNYPVEVGLLGDARLTLERLADAVERKAAPSAWLKQAQEAMRESLAELGSKERLTGKPISPELVCRELSELLPPDGVLVSDTGHCAVWTTNFVDLTSPHQRYIRCAGTLGWSFPASLGVKCALPERTVVCFTGDGGFCYHLAELETAARNGINTVIVVNNNQVLQQVKVAWDVMEDPQSRSKDTDMWAFKGLNLARVAEDLGCLGLRVEDPADLRGALLKAFSANRPTVIDVATDSSIAPHLEELIS
jgi:acetolactate synthase I/II/III large subunit